MEETKEMNPVEIIDQKAEEAAKLADKCYCKLNVLKF